jgi:hypothetical protein
VGAADAERACVAVVTASAEEDVAVVVAEDEGTAVTDAAGPEEADDCAAAVAWGATAGMAAVEAMWAAGAAATASAEAECTNGAAAIETERPWCCSGTPTEIDARRCCCCCTTCATRDGCTPAAVMVVGDITSPPPAGGELDEEAEDGDNGEGNEAPPLMRLRGVGAPVRRGLVTERKEDCCCCCNGIVGLKYSLSRHPGTRSLGGLALV